MVRRKLRWRRVAAAAWPVVAWAAMAPGQTAQPASESASPELEMLREEIRLLRQRVEQLEQRPPTQAEIEATKARIAADVAANQPVIKYDTRSGLYIGTPDEAFSIRPRLALMVRYVANSEKSKDNTENGFELRRLKFYASGTVFTRDLTYYVDVGVTPSTGGLSLVDAFATYRFYDAWYLRAGQFKNPYAREFYSTDLRIFAADYSLVSELIGGHAAGRSKGVQLIYGNNTKASPITVHLTLTDGDRQNNTAWDSNTNSNFGSAARIDWRLFGDWASYPDPSHIDSPDDLLVLGAGTSVSQGDRTVYRSTVDAQWEFAGKGSLFVAGFLNHNTDEDRSDQTDSGFNVQLAWLVGTQWEPYVRYNATFFDEVQGNGEDSAQEFTVGLNYYPKFGTYIGNNAKFTIDVGYLPDGSPVRSSNLGIQKGSGEQWMTRVQFRFIL